MSHQVRILWINFVMFTVYSETYAIILIVLHVNSWFIFLLFALKFFVVVSLLILIIAFVVAHLLWLWLGLWWWVVILISMCKRDLWIGKLICKSSWFKIGREWGWFGYKGLKNWGNLGKTIVKKVGRLSFHLIP